MKSPRIKKRSQMRSQKRSQMRSQKSVNRRNSPFRAYESINVDEKQIEEFLTTSQILLQSSDTTKLEKMLIKFMNFVKERPEYHKLGKALRNIVAKMPLIERIKYNYVLTSLNL
jgi:hypothetical protein